MDLGRTIRHLIVGRLRWLIATGDERDAEILALRHQILVLQRHVDRPRFTDADRTILAVLSTVFARSRLQQVMLIVQPQTGDRLAPSPRRPPLDLSTQDPTRATVDARRDPPTYSPPCAGEPNVGLPTRRRRTLQTRLQDCSVDGLDNLAGRGDRPNPGPDRTYVGAVHSHPSERHHRDRLCVCRHREGSVVRRRALGFERSTTRRRGPCLPTSATTRARDGRFLPLEIHELVKRVTFVRVTALTVNIARLIYLVVTNISSAYAAQSDTNYQNH